MIQQKIIKQRKNRKIGSKIMMITKELSNDGNGDGGGDNGTAFVS